MNKISPKIAISIIVFVVIGVAGAIYLNSQKADPPTSAENVTPTSSDSPTLAAQAEYYTLESSKTATSSPTPIPTPPSIKEYTYPGATVDQTTQSSLKLSSADSADKINTWYKDKIQSSNFNAKSFSQTNTNGTILNKLSAVKPGEKIEITIKKDQTQSKVTITVDRS